MAEITIRQIVTQLSKEGHHVTYIQRADGGIRITSIDGIKYTGSKGNTVARTMAGVTLSTRRTTQLKRISAKKRKTPLSKEVKKTLQRVQRKWRKRDPITKGTGTVTTKNVRYTIEHYGEQEALERLLESERYAEGLAYSKVVKALLSYIDDTILTKTPPEDEEYISEAMMLIATNITRMKDEWILPLYDLFYDYRDKKISANEVLIRVKKRLG